MPRFVLEGEWTGYRPSQQRVVHREIISSKRARGLQLTRIIYTDGTMLLIHARVAEPRERIRIIHSYSELIRDAEKFGGSVVRVADLVEPDPQQTAPHLMRKFDEMINALENSVAESSS